MVRWGSASSFEQREWDQRPKFSLCQPIASRDRALDIWPCHRADCRWCISQLGSTLSSMKLWEWLQGERHKGDRERGENGGGCLISRYGSIAKETENVHGGTFFPKDGRLPASTCFPVELGGGNCLFYLSHWGIFTAMFISQSPHACEQNPALVFKTSKWGCLSDILHKPVIPRVRVALQRKLCRKASLIPPETASIVSIWWFNS